MCFEINCLGECILFWLTTIGTIIALFSFLRVTYFQKKRYDIERSKYATDMIKEWNTNSATDTNVIQCEYGDDYYNKCKPIPLKEIENKIKQDKNFRDSVKRLFNYFEYVATAYNTSADKRIIERSFTLTIIRYSQLLENYLLFQLFSTKRNHWVPVTEFVKEQIESKKYMCKFCNKTNDNNEICFIHDDEYNKLLSYFNKDYLTKKDREEVESIYNKRLKKANVLL